MKSAFSISEKRTYEVGIDNKWITCRKYLFLMYPILTGLPIISAYLAVTHDNGAWLWSSFVLFYFLLAGVDLVVGRDSANPDEELTEHLKSDNYYNSFMYLTVAVGWASIFVTAYALSIHDFPLINYIGAALSVGLTSVLCTNIGHELGHKVRNKAHMMAAKFALASGFLGHFNVEHNKGHHVHVATPEDSASSRMGESIYKFVRREMPGGHSRAWRLERDRLARVGKSVWSLENEIIQGAIITLTGFSIIISAFGLYVLPFLLLVALTVNWELTCANYIEHYGLLREKKDSGRYERCQPQHSWNANQTVSGILTLFLQRHSDHHANPSREFQILRDYDDVPKLPHGYGLMIVIAMFPSLWFRLMDPILVDWVGGDMKKVNMDVDKKESLFGQYHQSPNDAPEDKAA